MAEVTRRKIHFNHYHCPNNVLFQHKASFGVGKTLELINTSQIFYNTEFFVLGETRTGGVRTREAAVGRTTGMRPRTPVRMRRPLPRPSARPCLTAAFFARGAFVRDAILKYSL